MAQYSTAVRNAKLAAMLAQLGSGGTLKVYTGSSPGVGNSATGTLLSTLTAVTFGSPSGGAVSATATADSSNAASGTPGYIRLATSGGTAIADFTSGDFSFNANPTLGGTDTLTSFTLTEGGA